LSEEEKDVHLHYEHVVFQVTTHFLRDNLGQHFPLDEVARQSGTNKKKLSAIFMRYAGMTVFEWMREERLRRSAELLMTTSLSIQDIADEVGFCNACNFSTAFRMRMGRTPNQFRKESQTWPAGLASGHADRVIRFKSLAHRGFVSVSNLPSTQQWQSDGASLQHQEETFAES
jgi:AraC-like DNA-binding protein